MELPTAEGRTAMPPSPDEAQWRAIDRTIRGWWDADTTQATEHEIIAAHPLTNPAIGELLFLPFPYVPPSGSNGTFTTMFAWDTPDFTSRALLAHDRLDLVRDHLRNYLFMVSRFGYMPNANLTSTMTRSQTPLVADTVWRYYEASGDDELLAQAYPLLQQNYRRYWNAPHHQTPIGLATNRDLGDPYWPPELASEAETGWDWTPIFGGDVRRCVPLITNCALVRYARVLARIAARLGHTADAAHYEHDADHRSALIRQYCWNEQAGHFVEYDYVTRTQLPYLSTCTFYPLWAGVASMAQARRVIDALSRLEMPHGLACTDMEYADPHPHSYPELAPSAPKVAADVPDEMVGGLGQLQWMYPAGWAPEHLIAVEALDVYGFGTDAARVATRFLNLVLDRFAATGRLWEKYNVVDGSLVLPNSRCGNVPLRGWTAAAVVLLGRRVLLGEPLTAASPLDPVGTP